MVGESKKLLHRLPACATITVAQMVNKVVTSVLSNLVGQASLPVPILN